MDWITDPEIWASLLTLTAIEIVLGVDNLVFIAILAGRLPAEQQNRARPIGLALRYPTVKMLALSFLMLIGMSLIADGAGFHVPKGYMYAAIGFSVSVEVVESTRRASAQR
jgi:predicted tellurium resistance membrane protein TerC